MGETMQQAEGEAHQVRGPASGQQLTCDGGGEGLGAAVTRAGP